MAPSLQRTLALATPFVFVALLHYGKYAAETPSGLENIAGRARAPRTRTRWHYVTTIRTTNYEYNYKYS